MTPGFLQTKKDVTTKLQDVSLIYQKSFTHINLVCVCCSSWCSIEILVGGFRHFLFSIICGMSLFPETNSYYSRWLKPPTRNRHHWYIRSHSLIYIILFFWFFMMQHRNRMIPNNWPTHVLGVSLKHQPKWVESWTIDISRKHALQWEPTKTQGVTTCL
jgi:hypothetical protein